MQQYFKIGKLAASTGLKGELILQHSLGKKTDLTGVEAIFLPDGTKNFLPYFLESSKARSATEIIIKLENIDVPEQARKLTPKDVWLAEADFHRHAGQAAAISLLGFTLFDKQQPLGEIVEVIEQPHQLLCAIMINQKEALIPVHENNLLKIDKKKKQVVVDVPDGLLEVFS